MSQDPARKRLPLWISPALVALIFIIVINFDPVGDALERIAPNADSWATNIFFIILIVYYFWKEKKKG
jgi:hypothetical protein